MRGLGLAGSQILLAAGVLAVLSVIPPERGAMLLVSTTGMSPGAILSRTMPAGALPLRAGPVAGSIVVRGERGRIAAAAMPLGILVLAAPADACGETA
ncbi:MAG TPA: hypothetical protein VEB68_02955 [Croceibacterium sp.]|nr:hypothetical protein [Croceibacterium sp.]